ncbi:MAG: acetylornithine transaminase [Thermodesulfatator sp.]|nr:MAG: acetylornithine transaminase [Thermodesulfatator sp.]
MGYLREAGEIYLARNYRRFPVAFVRGRGARLWDEEGREYLDFCAGIAVCALGHSPPEVVQAIRTQAERLLHVSNLYWTEPQVRLARVLVEHSFAERVFFCNSGAEAVEAALKLARRRAWLEYGPGKTRIVALENSFHGRTYGALSATGQPAYWEGFEPLVPDFVHIPPNDLEALSKAVDERTCAVILEPILGEGGVIPLSREFLETTRRLCDRNGALLIFDEIQTGIGRTGHLFAYEHYGILPDVLCLAKGLAGGLPLGAVLAREGVMEALSPGSHASTFGGNPVCCAAALAVLERVLAPDFLAEVRLKGKALEKGLRDLCTKFPEKLRGVRGLGLLLALETRFPASELLQALFEKRILTTAPKPEVLRFTPPLIISYREIDALLAALEEILASS